MAATRWGASVSQITNFLSCCTTAAETQSHNNELTFIRPLVSHKRLRGSVADFRRSSGYSGSEDVNGVVSLVGARSRKTEVRRVEKEAILPAMPTPRPRRALPEVDSAPANVPRHVTILLSESRLNMKEGGSQSSSIDRQSSDNRDPMLTLAADPINKEPPLSRSLSARSRNHSNLRTKGENSPLTSRQPDGMAFSPPQGRRSVRSATDQRVPSMRRGDHTNDATTPIILRRVASRSMDRRSASMNRQVETKSHSSPMTMRNATYLTSPQTLRRSRARTPKPNAPPEASKLVKVTMSNFAESAFYQSFSKALKKAGIEGSRTPRSSSTSPRTDTMALLRVSGEALYNGTLMVQYHGQRSTLNCNADFSTFWWNDPQRKLIQTSDIKQSLHWVQILQVASLHPYFTKPPLMSLKEDERRSLVMVEYLDHALTVQRAWWVMQSPVQAKSLAVLLRCLSAFPV